MAGIYLHIPFCRRACHYCDFHFSTNLGIKREVVNAMCREIELRKDYLANETIQSIYFGGGTPSLLTEGELMSIINFIKTFHSIAPDAEITLEANPDDISPDVLVAWRSAGINRLSIGIQSLDDEILRYLNRIHDASTANRSVVLAKDYGFENISVDLMYAIPGLSLARWRQDVVRLLSLNPQHLSAYSLTIEDNTAFGKWYSKGTIIPVDEPEAAEQLELLMEIMTDHGFTQYEISNFAKPGYESRHNSAYWSGEKYLGIGPGAHSYDKSSRARNLPNNHLYVKAIREDRIPSEMEMLSASELANEYILTTLRTDKGCDIELLKNAYGYDLAVKNEAYLERLRKLGHISFDGSVLKLTSSGKLLADKISSDLFLT